MGVPALFRWLSKKYPKIINSVVEEEPLTLADGDGVQMELPVDITTPNPNGIELDCLYLDMNGIVHPCTHPEGKEAPETEDAMMVEIFKYTERVVNMVRPRKLLFMAIDGVAPRAKMNQQRSRRFRAGLEAKEKEEEKAEAMRLFAAMGHPVSEETANKKAFDSNAITPGTPFMELLATSLRYWVVSKMNSDPGWKNLQVIISDASVPGEGEHKIMDFIRRQRVNPDHDPNTQHVIYGLDADLIMLSLATHEPHFRVLREDVFADDAKNNNRCRICGQEGHFAAQCTGAKKIKADEHDVKSAPVEKKPFIFLNVEVLREYLEIELNIPYTPFPFEFERAIDDWIFLIFFVGNDFLPHMPSLDIREGAIDTLLRIWKRELPRMGGYLTDNGHVNPDRVQIILDGLARSESDIFLKRKEAEERQNANSKRRRTENGGGVPDTVPYGQFAGAPAPQTTPAPPPIHHSLPARPTFDIVPARALSPTAAHPAQPMIPVKTLSPTAAHPPQPMVPMSGSNRDIVQNRHLIRTANMSAAEKLKAEMANLRPLGRNASKHAPTSAPISEMPQTVHEAEETSPVVQEVMTADGEIEQKEPAAIRAEAQEKATYSEEDAAVPMVPNGAATQADLLTQEPAVTEINVNSNMEIVVNPTVNGHTALENAQAEQDGQTDRPHLLADREPEADAEGEQEDSIMDGTIVDEPQVTVDDMPLEDDVPTTDANMDGDTPTAGPTTDSPRGLKRKADDVDEEDPLDVETLPEDDEDAPNEPEPHKLKKNADGTVFQEDNVRLWEPGYRERYYRDKFGVELSDRDFVKSLTKSYIEGVAWVLHYYYQGTPSWQWYFPHHFAPFAQDFEDVAQMDIKFELGAPFKPYEQLMGVFPASSRVHIPATFHELMTEPTSPIIDFYPETFSIDMNGKKMAWQGVALLPFIDPKRLLDAMAEKYPGLTEDEIRRNKWGNNVLYISDGHPLFDSLSLLYGKRRSNEPVPINTKQSLGIAGSVMADPDCIPGSTYFSPLTSQGLPDIEDDHSLSVLFFYPKQITPHRSVLLRGLRMPPRVLDSADLEWIRSGGGGRGRGRGGPMRDNNPNSFRGGRGGYGGGYGGGGTYGGAGYSEGGRENFGREMRGGQTQNRPPRFDSNNYGGRGQGSGGPPAGASNGGYGGQGGQRGQSNYGGYGGGYDQRQQSYGGRDAGYNNNRGQDNPSYGGYGGYAGYGGNSNGHNSYGGYGGGGDPNSYGGRGSGYESYGGPPSRGSGNSRATAPLPNRGRGRGRGRAY